MESLPVFQVPLETTELEASGAHKHKFDKVPLLFLMKLIESLLISQRNKGFRVRQTWVKNQNFTLRSRGKSVKISEP